MVQNMGGFVHLTQDEEHLIVYELLVLFEVTAHVLLQLITNLQKHGAILFIETLMIKHEVFLMIRHELGCVFGPTSFDVMFSRSWKVMMVRSLAPMRHSVLSRSVGLQGSVQESLQPLTSKNLRLIHQSVEAFLKRSLTRCIRCRRLFQLAAPHLSTNMVGESGRVVSRSVMAFHSLTQLCSELTQLA